MSGSPLEWFKAGVELVKALGKLVRPKPRPKPGPDVKPLR